MRVLIFSTVCRVAGLSVRGAQPGREQRDGEREHDAVRLQRATGAARTGQEERATRVVLSPASLSNFTISVLLRQ